MVPEGTDPAHPDARPTSATGSTRKQQLITHDFLEMRVEQVEDFRHLGETRQRKIQLTLTGLLMEGQCTFPTEFRSI
jgi:hypothetical protein